MPCVVYDYRRVNSCASSVRSVGRYERLIEERFYGDFMQVCEHCKYRYSWDCDDGRPYPKGGCDDFELDPSTLTNKQKKAIKRVLRNEEYSESQERGGWY